MSANKDIEAVIDQAGLTRFTNAMWTRLEEMREAGKSGWYNHDSEEHLSKIITNHLSAGSGGMDLIDAANALMMLWNNDYLYTPGA